MPSVPRSGEIKKKSLRVEMMLILLYYGLERFLPSYLIEPKFVGVDPVLR